MRCPTFKMLGSKARTATWLMNFFPKDVNSYFEPFTGRGNVYYRWRYSGGNANNYYLNDLNLHNFLIALRDYSGDYSFVDEPPINKALWQKWKDSPDSFEKSLAESYIARMGNVYSMGPNNTCSKNKHSRESTIKRMKFAKLLLKSTSIQKLDWLDFLQSHTIKEDDFVYVDPPYNVKQAVFYDNIDHEQFLNYMNSLNCKVAISGYYSELYDSKLKNWKLYTRERSSTAKKVIDGKKKKVVEHLWLNY